MTRPPNEITVTVSALPPLRAVADSWRRLEACADCTFFLSWTWIGAWLATLTETGYPVSDLHLISARRDGRVVGLAVVAASPRRALVLNQTGESTHTDMYLEYNDILVDAAVAEAREACLDFMRRRWPWRRLRIQAAGEALSAAVAKIACTTRTYRTESCAYADLSSAADADAWPQFLGLLSSNTRQQINRARRRAESGGTVTLTRAETPEVAREFLAELIALHGAAWHERKQKDGAFASPLIRGFVERLVRDGARDGARDGTVELLRIRAGETTLGVLLNFVWRGEAYSYQSGFAYSDDNRDKPGLLCHALAAADYIRRGVRAYHFMAGQDRYKRSLSNATEELRWIEIYPNAAVARAEEMARSLWHGLKKLRPPREKA